MPGHTAVLLILFFLSGASGLVYEVLWTRQLALIFGVTTYAISAVLATYMGGLALGSYLMGRRVDRVEKPLLYYAGLEAGIGLYALLVPFLLKALRPIYIELAHLDLSYPVFSMTRALLAALLLLIPTTMMGATFPVLIRYWTLAGRGLKRGSGLLYFVNTAGAIVGCSLAGFILIERFGLTGTNQIAAFTNVALAALAVLVSRRALASQAGEPRSERREDPEAALPVGLARLVLICAGLSGFISLVSQVLWSRALLRYLYNSTYAFTAMLSAFLLGIALGSALFTTFLAHRRRPLLVLAVLQAGVAVGFAVTLWLFPLMPEISTWIFGGKTVDSFARSIQMMVVQSIVILVPPVVLLGAIFPASVNLYAAGRHDVGNAVGHVYAANTLGAILGSLGCAFVLIPTIGMWSTQKLLIALSLLASGAVLAAVARGLGVRAMISAASLATVAIAFSLAPADVFRSTFLRNPQMTLDFYEEGSTDTVGVQAGYGQRTIVYEDQRGTASTASYDVNLFLGHLPMLIHPGTPRRVLHICFGVGNSLSAVAAHRELERVDNVELSPHVVSAGPLLWSNDNVLENPKVRTIIDDGRNYLMTTSETYDVIMLEPPETFTAGVINLYTTEFYRDAFARLAPDGVMMQWVPTANGTIEDEKGLFRAFSDVFPHAIMWWQTSGGCALLIGTKQPLRIDYQRLRKHWKEPRVSQDMALSQVRDVDHFLSFFTFDEAAFADYVRDAEPTRDDHTVLDFSMPRFAGSGFGLGQFNKNVEAEGFNPFFFTLQRKKFYMDQRRSVVPYLTNLGGEAPAAIQARIEARRGLPFTRKLFQEEEWRAMREKGLGKAAAAP